MDTSDMRQAIEDAELILRRADNVATNLATLLVGRLRHVDFNYWNNPLDELKKELKSYNAATKKWKD